MDHSRPRLLEAQVGWRTRCGQKREARSVSSVPHLRSAATATAPEGSLRFFDILRRLVPGILTRSCANHRPVGMLNEPGGLLLAKRLGDPRSWVAVRFLASLFVTLLLRHPPRLPLPRAGAIIPLSHVT